MNKKYEDSKIEFDGHEFFVKRDRVNTVVRHTEYDFWFGYNKFPHTVKIVLHENATDDEVIQHLTTYKKAYEVGLDHGARKAQSEMKKALGLDYILDDIRDEIRYLKNK